MWGGGECLRVGSSFLKLPSVKTPLIFTLRVSSRLIFCVNFYALRHSLFESLCTLYSHLCITYVYILSHSLHTARVFISYTQYRGYAFFLKGDFTSTSPSVRHLTEGVYVLYIRLYIPSYIHLYIAKKRTAERFYSHTALLFTYSRPFSSHSSDASLHSSIKSSRNSKGKFMPFLVKPVYLSVVT